MQCGNRDCRAIYAWGIVLYDLPQGVHTRQPVDMTMPIMPRATKPLRKMLVHQRVHLDDDAST